MVTIHKRFRVLWEKLLQNDKFLLTTHVKPDADGWGSQVGLSYLLQMKGKDVVIYNNDPFEGPEGLVFTNNSYHPTIFTTEEDFDHSILEDRVVVSLDNSSIDRISKPSKYIHPDHSNLIVIDHHDGIESDDDIFFMFPEASACAEIIYMLMAIERIEPPLEVAQALYLGLISDSGHFKYRKTNPLTHQVAARLLKHKINPAEISEAITSHYSPNRFKARHIAYNTLQTTEDFRIAWFALHMDDLTKEGCSKEDIDGFIDELFEVKDVLIGIVFVQNKANFTRISFRSRYSVNILPVAEKYSGGGHQTACATGVNLPLEATVAEIIPQVKKCLPNHSERQ